MRPSRIIVGEVRAAECGGLLLALNAGLPGMCILHVNSAWETLVKMGTRRQFAGADSGRSVHRPLGDELLQLTFDEGALSRS